MTTSQNQLISLTNSLRAEWEQTKQQWSDAKSREFEQRFLTELFSGVSQTVTHIESLERVLAKIRQDCE